MNPHMPPDFSHADQDDVIDTLFAAHDELKKRGINIAIGDPVAKPGATVPFAIGLGFADLIGCIRFIAATAFALFIAIRLEWI